MEPLSTGGREFSQKIWLVCGGLDCLTMNAMTRGYQPSGATLHRRFFDMHCACNGGAQRELRIYDKACGGRTGIAEFRRNQNEEETGIVCFHHAYETERPRPLRMIDFGLLLCGMSSRRAQFRRDTGIGPVWIGEWWSRMLLMSQELSG